jgi:hypothetical protein
MKNAKVLMLVTMLLGFAIVAYGFDPKPNFTGNWKLNNDKSNFGPLQAPRSATVRVQHKDPDFKIDFRQDEEKAALACTTDGNEHKECTGIILGIAVPVTVASKVVWEGGALIFVSKGEFNGAHVQVRDRWTLSEDGKTTTIHRHAASSTAGETDQTIVLEKQP